MKTETRKRVTRSELKKVLARVRAKLTNDTEAGCGVFWSDQIIYIMPPDDDDGPIYILPRE